VVEMLICSTIDIFRLSPSKIERRGYDSHRSFAAKSYCRIFTDSVTTLRLGVLLSHMRASVEDQGIDMILMIIILAHIYRYSIE
jgi:hypothetical protein